MSSVFWCLLDEDILKRVPIIGFGRGRELRKEMVDRGKESGSVGRVRGLAVLSRHIDVTGQVKIRQIQAAAPSLVNIGRKSPRV